MKKDKEIEQEAKSLSFMERLSKVIGDFIMVFLTLILLIGIITLLIILIEHPISLAIICFTILMIIIWVTK